MLIFDIGMVFCPIIGYIDQYRTVRKTHSSRGFSLVICGILLFSNIIRIFFWALERFNYALLFQAIVMSTMQLLLLKLCLKYLNGDETVEKSQFCKFNLLYIFNKKYWKEFWNWTSFSAYIVILSWLCIIISIFNFMFLHSKTYANTLGTLALGIEAALGIPQVLKIKKQKSSKGFSKTLLFTWVVGDVFKSGYYVLTSSPYQFIFCGFFQLFTDFVIIFLCIYYRKNDTTSSNKITEDIKQEINDDLRSIKITVDTKQKINSDDIHTIDITEVTKQEIKYNSNRLVNHSEVCKKEVNNDITKTNIISKDNK